MFKNYLKIAWRNLTKQKLFSLINIFGLAIGLSCSIIIFLFVQNEFSFDQFHSKKDRIYRVSQSFLNSNGWNDWVLATGPVGLLIKDEIPQIEKVALLSGADPNTIVQYKDFQFLEDKFSYVNPGFFEVFDFKVKSGNPVESLKLPYTVLLSESTAQKYFRGTNPIGQNLMINNEREYTVSGVFEDFPDNSHIDLDFLASYESLFQSGKLSVDNWGSGGAYTYALINKNSTQQELDDQLNAFRDKYIANLYGTLPDSQQPRVKLMSTALQDIHLYSNFDNEQIPQGDIRYIYLFSAIALLILIIGCINYVNLSTAKAMTRAKEVGVRKTSGASQFSLIKQYLGESFLTVLLALIISIFIIELVLPYVNNLLSRSLSLTQNLVFIISTYGILWIVTGITAGFYPAFFLSRFKPISSLKGSNISNSKAPVRKALIVFQLGSAIVLLLSTIVIQNQMDLIQEMNPGFDEEQVLMIPNMREVDGNFDLLKQELEKNPGVLSVTTSSYEPGIAGGLSFHKGEDIEGVNSDVEFISDNIFASADFHKTFGLQMVEGEMFDWSSPSDLKRSIVVNETAVKELNWSNPIGKRFIFNGNERFVIGVMQDFPTSSIKEKIKPTIVFPTNSFSRLLAIRVAPENLQNTISDIEEKWANILPNIPLSYQFLDDRVYSLYLYELNLSKVLTIFCFLAIFVACLGLIGLSAFSTQQKAKEIGIRKVLGANLKDVLTLITKDFLKWYFLGLIIAVPIAIYVNNLWLKSFEYSVTLNLNTFVLAIAISITFVLLSVSYQSIKAALVNPVKSLKSE